LSPPLNATALRLPINLPLSTCSQHLSTQCGCQRPWQHDDPVFATFSLTHDDDVAVKIHILDTQPKPFHQAHARAIQQAAQQLTDARHESQQAGNFFFGQNAGNAPLLGGAVDVIEPGQINTQNFPV